MLNTFSIENFRLFRQIEIAHLGQVNLLVGKNNSGKSAFLEAITVYASNASPLTLRDVITDREETWKDRNQEEIQRSDGSAIRHLFRGHQLPKFGETGIVLGPVGTPSEQLQLLTGAFEFITEEDGSVLRRMVTPAAVAQGEAEFELYIVAQEGDKHRRLLRVDQPLSSIRISSVSFTPTHKYPFQIVPTRNLTTDKIAALWDTIGLTNMADEVIDGLKLIEPSLTGILFVQSTVGRDTRMPLASSSKASEPLPLKSMGDGITRLFHIIVALVSARNGILLIDEFENGLHWSVQLAVWKTVFRLAERLNVQVFATTHSRDCIAGFEGAWMEHRDSGAFFRLQLDAAGIPAIRAYSLETLADSLDTDVEVR